MKNKIIINKKYLIDDRKIKLSLDFIKSTNFDKVSDGKIQINSDIWANLQTYFTKQDALFEAHKKYVDLQYIIKGEELIYISNYDNCIPEINYDNKNDIEFLNTDKSIFEKMKREDFLILYPADAHKPSIQSGKSTKVRKLVVKIPVDKVLSDSRE